MFQQASKIARERLNIKNILQPGIIKEIIIAEKLGHKVIGSKHKPDAHDLENESIVYEYLSFQEGGSGQLDRMFKFPKDKRDKSLQRIKRNNKFYFAVFDKNDSLKCLRIYETETEKVLKEAVKQLDRSSNEISHIGFKETWIKNNSKLVKNL